MVRLSPVRTCMVPKVVTELLSNMMHQAWLWATIGCVMPMNTGIDFRKCCLVVIWHDGSRLSGHEIDLRLGAWQVKVLPDLAKASAANKGC